MLARWRKLDRRYGGYLVVGGLVALLLSLQLIPQTNLRRATSRRLLMRMHRAPDADVPALLAQIAELDDPGLPTITAALGDDRPVVSLAARDLLQRRLDQWTMLPAPESSSHVAQVAETLAAVSPSLGANQRAHAARLAERLLQWPVDRNVVNATQLVANCEQVINDHRDGQSPATVAQAAPASHPTPRRIEPSQLSLPEASSQLPVEPADPPPPPIVDAATPPLPFTAPNDAPSASSPTAPLRTDPAAAPRVGGANVPGTLPSDTAPRISAADLAAVRRLPDMEVMRLLHSPEQSMAVAAIEELKRRGFQSRHLRLARRMTDPDPTVRRQLVLDLETLPDVDPVPWLKELMRDPDHIVAAAAEQAWRENEPEQYRARLRRMKASQDARRAGLR